MASDSEPSSEPPRSSFLSIPAPIRALFDRFPLVTYPENTLPAPRLNTTDHVLYIFGDGPISYNPACLKWQAYLKFSKIPFQVVSSNNHASPSGALPFLLSASPDSQAVKPVASGKLQRWTKERSSSPIEESEHVQYEAYLSLVEHRIRRAWVRTLPALNQTSAKS